MSTPQTDYELEQNQEYISSPPAKEEVLEITENVQQEDAQVSSNEPEKVEKSEVKADSKLKPTRQKKRCKIFEFEKCKSLAKETCPHYPLCCDFPLKTSLQLLAVLDMIFAFFFLCLWTYFYQLDPFIERQRAINTSDSSTVVNGPGSIYLPNSSINTGEFQESTTLLGPPLFDDDVDEAAESLRYSKIAYQQKNFQQEIENGCGRQYYIDYLFGHKLNITRELFYEIIHVNYFADFVHVFCALSVMIATCCYLRHTSAKVFMIVVWHLELLPIFLKLWTTLASQSQRLCIFKYGLSKYFDGLAFLFWIQLLPLVMYRPYKILIFTHFIKSCFTPTGNLQIRTKVEGATMREYANRQEEYRRMDKNKKSSSEEDDEALS